MPTPSTRRPRFLESLPDAPEVSPLRQSSGTGAARAAPPPPSRGGTPRIAERPSAPPVTPASADAADLRREALARVANAVETLRAQSAHLGEQARADALEIGFVVARAILATEIRQNPEALFSLVRAAVARAGDSRRIAVRIAPEDVEGLQAAVRRNGGEATTAARIEILADRTLTPGDCIVDTDFGRVDARLDTRLAELRRAVDAASEGLREGVA